MELSLIGSRSLAGGRDKPRTRDLHLANANESQKPACRRCVRGSTSEPGLRRMILGAMPQISNAATDRTTCLVLPIAIHPSPFIICSGFIQNLRSPFLLPSSPSAATSTLLIPSSSAKALSNQHSVDTAYCISHPSSDPSVRQRSNKQRPGPILAPLAFTLP
jgi:hypothetical protein